MDEHLDTSWCPVCDKLILPKRFTISANAPPTLQSPSPNGALSRQSSARGKSGNGNASLKVLARNQGGGLVHGTGRIRPGGSLKRAVSSNTVTTIAQAQQQTVSHPAVMGQERTVIDQAQTPLYCSDECMKADLELANIPLSQSAPMDSPLHYRAHDVARRSYAQRSERNFTLPSSSTSGPNLPLPPNSSRVVSNGQPVRGALRLSLSELEESDGSLSGINSGTSTSYTTSPDFKESAQKTLTSPSLNNLSAGTVNKGNESEQGLENVTKQQQKLLLDTNSTTKSNAETDLQKDKNVYSGISHSSTSPISPTSPSAKARVRSAIELYSKYPLFAKSRSTSRSNSRQALNLMAMPTVSGSYTEAYAFSSRASITSSFTHDNDLMTSPVDDAEDTRESSTTSSAVSVPSPPIDPHSSSKLSRMYAGKKLSTRYTEPRSILANGAEGKLLVPNVKLKPIELDVGFEYWSAPTSLTNELECDIRTQVGSPRTAKKGESAESERYGSIDGSGSRNRKVGRIANLQNLAQRRDASDPGLRRESVRSPLGSVWEEGAWQGRGRERSRRLERQASESTQDEEKEDGKSVKSHEHDGNKEEERSRSTSATVSRRGSRKGSESGRKGREGLKLHERGRLNMQARTWSYDNLDIPTYEPMPAVPMKQIRLEEVFIPDPLHLPSPTPLSKPYVFTEYPPRPASTSVYTFLEISPLHKHDTELSRHELRDIGARRGMHAGRAGWWIEKEWEVVAIPERKRLFLFGSGLATKTENAYTKLNA